MTYIGFVLGAMGADYYPRLSEAINDYPRARRLVNEQTEMALLFASPVLLAMITLAPWSSTCFTRQASRPLPTCFAGRYWATLSRLPVGPWVSSCWRRAGGILLSQSSSGTPHIWGDRIGNTEMGLVVAGAGFWFAYLILFFVIAGVASRLIGFKLDRRNGLYTPLLLLAGGLILFMDSKSTTMAMRLACWRHWRLVLIACIA